ncbi:DUF1772 domain-containing protein [Arthrobacter sp. Marseille-P9274]|nr:anthrone oxygenase family protein [Arthrobacter sp. Marseille-P9274]
MATTFEASELLTIAAGTGSAVAGGFYVAFSAVVMPALRSRPAKEAVETMNAVNRHAVRPPFLTIFFGTAAASVAVGINGVADGDPKGLVRALGAGLYLSGFLLTVAYSVPLNNRLAMAPLAEAAASWPQWARSWTRGNTVRAMASMAGAALMVGGR